MHAFVSSSIHKESASTWARYFCVHPPFCKDLTQFLEDWVASYVHALWTKVKRLPMTLKISDVIDVFVHRVVRP